MFRENHLSVRKIAKFKYFAKVIIYSKSPQLMLQSYIQYALILNASFTDQSFKLI